MLIAAQTALEAIPDCFQFPSPTEVLYEHYEIDGPGKVGRLTMRA